MKTLITLSLIGALALSTTAFADDSTPSPTPTTPSASKQCRTERSAMGLALFRMTYGTNKTKRNAFGKCVSKRTHATSEVVKEAKQNASKDCTAEETADPAAFTKKYGTGKHGANAHGKCVSQKAKSKADKAVDDQVDADVSAAKACRTERKADPAAFNEKYGTNKSKRNAFGKCVSKLAKANQDDKS
jgi:hypothetical protein